MELGGGSDQLSGGGWCSMELWRGGWSWVEVGARIEEKFRYYLQPKIYYCKSRNVTFEKSLKVVQKGKSGGWKYGVTAKDN